MTKLQKIGIGIAVIGSLAAAVNFFRLYAIPGRCLPGAASCDNLLANWRLHQRLALGLLAAGLVILVYGTLMNRRRK